MKLFILLVVLLSVFLPSLGYKIAIFTPDISGSQLIFNKKVAETLAKAGHEVVMYRIRAMGYKNVEVHVDQRLVKVADIITYSEADFEALNNAQEEVFFSELSLFDSKMRSAYQQFLNIFINSCSEVLQMKSLVISIAEENFDLAFASSYDYCAVGLIHTARIPTWIWLNSGPLTDAVAHDVGVSNPPSYVPLAMADAGDRMNFYQRFVNVILRAMMPIFSSKSIAGPETELFRDYIRPDFPDLRDLAQNCPLVMVNSHELYDFPRPTLGKIVNIGGLGMGKAHEHAKIDDALTEKLNSYNSAILFSLGTVANASQMSETWKTELVRTFAAFPKTLILFSYIGNDLDDKVSDNVLINKWFPQTALLHHPKVKLFITHCGYNSFQEAIYAAKPVVAIPLFGDQKRNARLVEKHGIGLRLEKNQVNFDQLSKTIRLVNNDGRFLAAVKKLNRQVVNRPFSAEETLVKWTEFLAEHKDLSQMNPAGNDLSFIQYHNLDVFWTMAFVLFVALYMSYKILSCFAACFTFKTLPQTPDHIKKD